MIGGEDVGVGRAHFDAHHVGGVQSEVRHGVLLGKVPEDARGVARRRDHPVGADEAAARQVTVVVRELHLRLARAVRVFAVVD